VVVCHGLRYRARVSVAASEAAPWPFLVVLMARPPEVKGEDGAPDLHVRGLGWLVGDYVATLAHVADRADVVAAADDGHEVRVEPLGSDETFALFRVGDDWKAGRAPGLAEATAGAACTVAMVRDDMPRVRLVPGRVDKLEPDGRFTVALEGRLADDHTASGSPVVSGEGAVIGIVGPTATSSSVDAFGLDELQRLISGSGAAPPTAETPSPATSTTTRSALGYALALAAAEGSPLGAAPAVLLGVLRSAVDDRGDSVPSELLAFVADRREPNAQSAASGGFDVDAIVRALGLPAPAYPADPPATDTTLQSSTLAPVLAAADALRARISPSGRLQRRFLLAAVLTRPATEFPAPVLESLGATLPELREALRDSIASQPDEPVELWTEALREPPPAQFDLAGGISADLVDPTRGIPLERDSLGVRDYVTMFANVIAERQTPMPLSFGLFGEWGSGKTTFMGLLHRQVETLAASRDPAYHTDIVQISFNAWHYADSNLWASLGDTIFEQLAGPGETDERRRNRLRTQLGQKLQRRKELEAAADQARREIARLSGELDHASAGRESSARDLMRAVVQTTEFRGQLQSAWKRIGVDDEVERARLLVGELSQTPSDIEVVRRALGAPWRWFLLLVLTLAAATVVALGVLASREWLTGAGLVTISSVAAIAGLLIARVSSGARLLHQTADNIRRQEVEKTAAERKTSEAPRRNRRCSRSSSTRSRTRSANSGVSWPSSAPGKGCIGSSPSAPRARRTAASSG
jgi:KAP family P-loop domain